MKLWLVNYELPPLGAGAGNATAHLARELARMGHSITVLTAAYGGLPRRERRDGYDVQRVACLRRRKDRSTPFEMATFALSASLRMLTQRARPDVVIAFFGFPSGPVAATLRRIGGVPYIISLRGGDVPGHPPKRLERPHRVLRPFLVRLWRGAFAVTAPSRGLADMARRSAPELAVHVIPNGVDCAAFAPPEAGRDGATGGEGREGRRILFSGRLSDKKQVKDLVAAVAGLDGPWTLTLAGDGPRRADLEAQVAACGCADRVTFLGWVDRARLPEVYAAADVFAFPSQGEGLPNTVLEAMASGLPVVATQVCGTDELVTHGETGILYPLGDVDALRAGLRRLLDDAALRRRYGAAGRRRVEQDFSWTTNAEQYAVLCRDAMLEPASYKAG